VYEKDEQEETAYGTEEDHMKVKLEY